MPAWACPGQRRAPCSRTPNPIPRIPTNSFAGPTASPPHPRRSYLEFYITLVQSGALTPRLFALKPGDNVFLGKKISGMFTLDEVPDGNNLILVG